MTGDAITIRAYRDDDWAAVCAVHDRARPDELRGSCDVRAFVPLAAERDDAASFGRSRKFVACRGERVVGFVGIDGTYVSWLYVDPDAYERGIGTRLLRLAIALIGRRAWTIALAGNGRARRLYEREGFGVVRSFETANAGYPCLAVELRLPPVTAVLPSGEWTTTAARKYAAADRLEDWIHAYLAGVNPALSKGLRRQPRWWRGPLEVALDDLARSAGPEPDMEYRQDPTGWERRVTALAHDLRDPVGMPPLIAEYRGEALSIRDGNHRHEAMRRRGWLTCWALVWYDDEADFLAQA